MRVRRYAGAGAPATTRAPGRRRRRGRGPSCRRRRSRGGRARARAAATATRSSGRRRPRRAEVGARGAPSWRRGGPGRTRAPAPSARRASGAASSTTGARSSRTPSSSAAGRCPAPAREPQRRDAALEVGERGLVGLRGPRARPSEVGADVPGAGPDRTRRAWRGRRQCSGVPSGVTSMPSRVRRASLLPDQVVGVVLAEPPRLAQHGGGGLLPVGAGVPSSSGSARASVPCSGSRSLGSSRPPSTASWAGPVAPCDVMLRTLGRRGPTGHPG